LIGKSDAAAEAQRRPHDVAALRRREPHAIDLEEAQALAGAAARAERRVAEAPRPALH
jgi:hypothetical protein